MGFLYHHVHTCCVLAAGVSDQSSSSDSVDSSSGSTSDSDVEGNGPDSEPTPASRMHAWMIMDGWMFTTLWW